MSFIEQVEAEGKKVYEDKLVIAIMPHKATALGHIRVYPREPVTSIDDLPSETMVQMFFCSSFAATAVFEGLGAQGTNIIINNGEAANQTTSSICIDVLPRKENDGLNFQWTPKQLSPEDMDRVKDQIKDCTAFIGKEKPKAPANNSPPSQNNNPNNNNSNQQNDSDEHDNYLTRKLIRIP